MVRFASSLLLAALFSVSQEDLQSSVEAANEPAPTPSVVEEIPVSPPVEEPSPPPSTEAVPSTVEEIYKDFTVEERIDYLTFTIRSLDLELKRMQVFKLQIEESTSEEFKKIAREEAEKRPFPPPVQVTRNSSPSGEKAE